MRTYPLLCAALIGLKAFAPISHADVISDWNRVANDYARQNAGFQYTRALAMVHVAQFDAINAVLGGYTPYALNVAAPGASAEAAAAQAAYTVLTNISRANVSVLNGALSRSLAAVPDGQAKQDGLAVGRLAANTIIRLRAADNMELQIPAPVSNFPGRWRSAPPDFAPGEGAQYRYFLPWTMRSQAQFRPGPPPALNSELYAKDLEEVRQLGSIRSTTRMPSQTAAARFHFAGVQSYLQPAVAQKTLPLIESARAHALLHMSLADGDLVFLEAQYAYSFWRPITAIRAAANDGNDATEPEATWTPLLATPNHPEYPSGTCTHTSSLATILIHFYGDDFAFSTTSRHGSRRSFDRLSEVVSDAVEARIAAGAHYRNSCLVGVEIGRQLARNALENFLRPVPQLAGARLSSGEFQLHLHPGHSHALVIESSADLNLWVPQRTNSLDVILHSDPITEEGDRRFYRALVQP